MKKLFNLFCFVALLLFSGCGEKNPEPSPNPEPPTPSSNYEVLNKGPFAIEIKDLHASYCTIHITPETLSNHYIWYGVTTESYLAEFGSLKEVEKTVQNYIDAVIDNNISTPIEEMVEVGEFQTEVKGLLPETRFVVFACHVNEIGRITSEVKLVAAKTPAVTPSANRFEIAVSEVTATNAKLEITTTNNDHYVWLELPEDIYAGMSESDIQAFLMQHYEPFFSIRSHSGNLSYDFEDFLEPETEYMIIVFGYDGGMTTGLTTYTFKTGSPGDATNVTFEVAYGTMGSRSVKVTIIPSDPSVAYLALVVDEELIGEYGGPNEAGVKALIDGYIEESIAYGECEDRGDFFESYSLRGTRTGNFSIIPGLEHYTCVVCVDELCNFVSKVTIDPFTVPGAEKTDASVKAAFAESFDGDLLARLDEEKYGDYAGKAVLPVSFTLENSAVKALYTLFDVATLEAADASEADILDSLLNDELIDLYNFYAEPRIDLLLDWDTDYKLYMVAFDVTESVGQLIEVEIPALSRAACSPIEEYEPIDGSRLPETNYVEVRYDKHFDGSALADLDAERFGYYDYWAVLPVEFTFGLNTDRAICMVLDEYNWNEIYSDSRASSLLLDESNIGDLTFYATPQHNLRLEWGTRHRLYMIAVDANGYPGEVVTIELPVLYQEEVSPVEEYPF